MMTMAVMNPPMTPVQTNGNTLATSWREFYTTQEVAMVVPFVWIGVIAWWMTAMVMIYKKTWAPALAPLYALLEGFVVGGVSAIFEVSYPGIVIQAVGLTIGTLACLLMAYKSGLIKATENFKLGVVAATGGIALLYLVSMVM